jgi:hypothetical protein
MAVLNPLNYLGQSWSLWPAYSPDGGLNIVSGVEKVSAHIISILLIRPGEDLMHPGLPLAPDLFDPLSDYNAQYWVYTAEQQIRRYVSGLDDIRVSINTFPDPENKLAANIQFRAKDSPDTNALTFGWYEYQGAIAVLENVESFLDSVYLNGNKMQRFRGFSR